jgi:hypothetical protein
MPDTAPAGIPDHSFFNDRSHRLCADHLSKWMAILDLGPPFPDSHTSALEDPSKFYQYMIRIQSLLSERETLYHRWEGRKGSVFHGSASGIKCVTTRACQSDGADVGCSHEINAENTLTIHMRRDTYC